MPYFIIQLVTLTFYEKRNGWIEAKMSIITIFWFRIENQISVEKLFKTIWADHADMISIQYTGTGKNLFFRFF